MREGGKLPSMINYQTVFPLCKNISVYLLLLVSVYLCEHNSKKKHKKQLFTVTLYLKDRIQSLSAVNSFTINLGDTCPSCIGIIKLIEVKSVEQLLVLCTPFLRSLSLLPYFMQDVAKITFYRKASGQTTCVLMSGAIGMLIDIFRFLQVESIASMFDLDPNRPIWIVKKSASWV